jgi:hypothetical protein
VKRLIIVVGAFCAFLIGYGATTLAFPAGGVNGRGEYNGYFTNVNDTNGTYVLPQDYDGGTMAIPNSLNSTTEFINFVKYTKLDIDNNGSGNRQEKTGAAFIIHTMIGSPIGSRGRPPTAAQIAEWERRVNYAASRGWITWNVNYSYRINSFYQGTRGGTSGPNDDAMYDHPGTSGAIVFRNSAGKIVYAIRRICANPVGGGSLGPIPDDAAFNMDGRTVVNNPTPKPGDVIRFRHYVKNLGPGAAPSVNWSTYNTIPNPDVRLANGGPAAYADDQERFVNFEDYTVPAGTAAGTRICREVGYAPDTAAGGSGRGDEVCAVVRYDFDLVPNVTVEINDGTTTGGFAEVGDKVEFIFAVNNNNSTQSQSTACTIYGQNTNGYRATPATGDTSSTPGYAPPATGCPRVFPHNANTVIVTETISPVTATSGNKTLCRTLAVTPFSPAGGTRSAIGCVTIANKPYMRVYGGDVSAGNGFMNSGSCTTNSEAGIVGWNKESGGLYAGAGAQFAALALNTIYDFATGQGNTTPTDGKRLAFANTTATGTSKFGGDLGTMPCIPDYASAMPAGATDLGTGSVNLSSLSGQQAYKSGPVTISGNINPGQRTSLYVNGDVIINGNIQYTGSWSTTNMPLFQLVATGNIYIGRNVTQLDGLYVAQGTNTAGGIIYTCAEGAVPVSRLELLTKCNTKLTVNGSFVAFQVQFLRAAGTLAQSNATETGAAGQAGEVFNYSPLMWMVTPPAQATPGTYDSLTSLPPIL